MLIIRREQFAAFEEHDVKVFEGLMVSHIQKFFADEYFGMGDAGCRRFIRDGIEAAGRYGISGKRSTCRYIDLMLTLGADFDQNPQFYWAREILAGAGTPESKLEQIIDRILRA